jgi:hypothetical protein
VIDIRRLAAVDIAFLGSRFILVEFSIGAFGSLSLGVLTLVRTHSLGGTVFGAYLLCIGVNYLPLLVHAIDLARHGTARQEIADELQTSTECFASTGVSRYSCWCHWSCRFLQSFSGG